MRTFVVSDLHLRDGSKNDPFQPNKQRFFDFCKMIVEEQGFLVLNGDVLDFWRALPRQVVEAHYDILNFISEHMNYTWLVGNHDEDLEILNPLVQFDGRFSRCIYVEGHRIMHGFQLDKALDGKDERIAARVAAAAATLAGNSFAFIKEIERWLLEGHRTNERYIKRIVERFPEGKYIVGHSHFPEEYHGWFWNTGSWGVDQPDLTYVVIENGVAELKRF